MRKIKPYSSSDSLRKLDGRSKEARLLRKVRAELTAHIGGRPTITQKALIERAAWMTLHLGMMDRKMLGDVPSERDARQYLAWSNTLTRAIAQLGVRDTSERNRPPSLDELLASRRAAS
ncbi:hypothetical protein B0W47_17795 (plasmid) [Komagataeibacter nataicola]|uniref:Uncharacterized protein n=2 Tax=Komagataeibacter TaxID=1434011 RepID=A0A9N7D0H9_9PROT|nr:MULTISPECIES: hypothetical protein [Komagataeibacter]AQU89401.1 hypothetical protein B0W47_17795 [Komagataeibacter nataicola]PYD64951.1 hypothetical protein CDI09_16280 [Komagataeibacter nataicola]WNM10243.1 hypothetical protein RI056_18235 [Komagataeibacter nataicola]WNM10259.1 hypothetical protein RI056_18320 [Komagataeibacter nataicola]BAK83990.1 hypothetical protein GLX_15780 [Komagataeibacter medellinensis NBRC 3288]